VIILKAPEKIQASIIIIACNEEKRIAECLNSVKDFDDIVVVVDSKTNDKTSQIAEDFGCRVFIEDWKGDGDQKQSGITKSKHDWVLILDADERLSAGAVQTIAATLKDPGKADAYTLKRRSFISSRKINYSGWWPDRNIRLFNKNKSSIGGIVHAVVIVKGKTKNLDATMRHYSFNDYSHMVEKMNKYSSWSASVMYERKKKVTCMAPITHFAWMFFKTLIIRKGFIDGLDGLVISFLTGASSFLKYAKLLELQRKKKDG
jgi:glycosyltransferase involved in cell wall biosynthesis